MSKHRGHEHGLAILGEMLDFIFGISKLKELEVDMPAYLIADIEVTNPEGFKKYQEAVPATVEKHGGRYMVRGGDVEPMEGNWKPKRMVVLEFPNMTTLKKWYKSDDYQNIIADRTDNSIGNMVFVDGY
ncbi:MAG: hypothetical protein CFH10_00999 [Alphaproteobacteria bacterium MarineAlpha4_Bin2]|nr:MAG: hypothetical protein CFH10_00999 [Alphaproteobacteria bacterium MarineAlpha4_Bin2]